MKFLRKCAAVGCAAFAIAAGSAQAATFDFEAMANAFFTDAAIKVDSKNYEASFSQFQGSTHSGLLTDGSVTVTDAYGTNLGVTNASDVHAFFDSDTGNSTYAGLGVCSSGFNTNGVSKCSTNFGPNQSDDNVTAGETLFLEFNLAVFLVDTVLMPDANHNLTDGTVEIDDYSGAGFVTYNIVNGILQNVGSLAASDIFAFRYDPSREFYINLLTVTPVPIPAALPLFASALAGMGFFRWRRKRQIAA